MPSVLLKSGNTLEVSQADFKSAWELTQAIANELKVSLKEIGEVKDVQQLMGMDAGILFSSIMQLVSSKQVETSLWRCAVRCTLNGVKVGPDLFEDERHRGDFLPTAIEVIKANVVPFMKGLDLSSLASKAPNPDAQK
jgi:hypothetical protein